MNFDYFDVSLESFINNLLKHEVIIDQINEYDNKTEEELFKELMQCKIKLQHCFNINKNYQYFKSCSVMDRSGSVIGDLRNTLDYKNASEIALKYSQCLSTLTHRQNQKEIFFKKERKTKVTNVICMYCDNIINNGENYCEICGGESKIENGEEGMLSIDQQQRKYSILKPKDKTIEETSGEMRNYSLDPRNENGQKIPTLTFSKKEDTEEDNIICRDFAEESFSIHKVVNERINVNVEKGKIFVEVKLKDKLFDLSKVTDDTIKKCDIPLSEKKGSSKIVETLNSLDNNNYATCMIEDEQNTQWRCEACTFINKISTLNCAVCNTNNKFRINEDKGIETFLKVNTPEHYQGSINNNISIVAHERSGSTNFDLTTSNDVRNLNTFKGLEENNKSPGNDKWICSKCSYLNSFENSDCEVCEFEAPHKFKWRCEMCGLMNDDCVLGCAGCGIIDKRQIEDHERCWYSKCKNNVNCSKYCLKCGLDQKGIQSPGSILSRRKGNSMQHVWICTSCKHLTDAMHDKCERCGNSIFTKGKKTCTKCGRVISLNCRLCIKCDK